MILGTLSQHIVGYTQLNLFKKNSFYNCAHLLLLHEQSLVQILQDNVYLAYNFKFPSNA